MKKVLWILFLVSISKVDCLAQSTFDTAQIKYAMAIKSLGLSRFSYFTPTMVNAEIRNSKTKILKQKGFSNILFFNVTLYSRTALEWVLFISTLSSEEKKTVSSEPDQTKFDNLLKQKLSKQYKINDTTESYNLATLISEKEIQAMKLSGEIEDFVYLYDVSTGSIHLVFKDGKFSVADDEMKRKFFNLEIIDYDAIDGILFSEDMLKSQKKLPKNIAQKFYIENLGGEIIYKYFGLKQ